MSKPSMFVRGQEVLVRFGKQWRVGIVKGLSENGGYNVFVQYEDMAGDLRTQDLDNVPVSRLKRRYA